MINRFFITLIFFSLFSPALLRADELVLKEGKSLQGKITKEDEQEFTILLGSNMFLRVAKAKVAKVIRSPKVAEKRQTVTLKKSTATAVAVSEGPLVMAANVGSTMTVSKKETVSVHRTIVTSSKTVFAEPWPQVDVSFNSQWEGEPEHEGSQMKWKWAVVRATITSCYPQWTPPAKTSAQQILSWNLFLKKNSTYAAGVVAIYGDAAQAFADELFSLRASDEKTLRADSARLFNEMKERAEKRRSGFDRHSKKIFDASTD